jgi:2-methylisocitrate lyase-like PEP mutase family enzyme
MNISLPQKATAEQFLALHRSPGPFVLANSWDVVTARLFAQEGFRAIGTSSYATAAMLGLHDGEHFPEAYGGLGAATRPPGQVAGQRRH